ncbi:A-kinase anchor protein 11 isoform X1 [Antechinus flavipes]|uniref:A-kinase anchor protein 11 isoform X1 n=1 Tax=Antechinus flavipes TaxID=38775 RepID=UPI002236A69C|nr:A-kinase anchor protein 11 isoform X1 [Antechinus flavipes]
MDTYQTVKSNKMKTMKATVSVKKSFIEGVLQSIKSLLQSQKELCIVSAEEYIKPEEQANMIEVTFLDFNEETDTGHMQDLATVSLELPDLLNSIHFCNLNENEIIFLKDINKSFQTNADPQKQNHFSSVLCVMKVSPATSPRLRVDFVFNLLSKYATGIRYTLETYLRQKRHLEKCHGDDDDTNQSVSSIEDDFVTAFEQLDEDEPSKMHSDGISFATLQSQCDAASQTIPAHCLEASDSEFLITSMRQKSVAKSSSSSLINVWGFKERPSNVKNSVTTSISEPWTQRSLYKSCHPSDINVTLQKTLFSSSPADSSESECSSPSPVIFLDEEGYQKSLKAKLELPKIPVGKDGIEDSDSEIGEFFDSFDQFDEVEQASDASCQLKWEPVVGNPSKKRVHKHGKSCSITTTMNPQKFKFDRPTLPANVRKPTPRKPESPYSNLYDVPDSPRPVKTSGEDSGLFSPIRSSAFSPLGNCTTTECYCHIDVSGEKFNENHDNIYYHAYSDYANNVSCEILGSVFHSQFVPKYTENQSCIDSIVSTLDLKPRELDWKVRSKHKSLMIKQNIQKFAADLVEKSFGYAFKDLQKGVSSCTNALCSLAMKLTSSVFDMAFNEIGRQRASSLKQRAICGLASFLVGDALTSALRDLHFVKKQIFTNTAARFAADLAEELIFEGLMEVCQFSHPSTPTGTHNSPFDYEDKVVKSYAKDLSESVIQEAFIELSQVDVTFTTKAAISVSMDNIKYVSAESVLQSTQTSASFPTCHDQMLIASNPVQDYRKEYTVQQALFCTSGIVTSIPVPLAGSALGRYYTSSNTYQLNSHLPSDNSHKMNNDSTQTSFMTKNKEEEVACLKNIYLSSKHNASNENNYEFSYNQDDLKLTNNIGINNCSELACDLSAINNFSGAMVDMIVTETYEAIATSKITKGVGELSDYLKKGKAEEKILLTHDGASLQHGESSSKNYFADHLSKYIIKYSIDESTLVASNNKNVAHSTGMPTCVNSFRKDVPSLVKKHETTEKQFLPAVKEESQLTLNEVTNFQDGPYQSTQDMPLLIKDYVPEYKESVAPKISSAIIPPCPDITFQGQNIEELTEAMDVSIKPFDKSLKKHDLSKTVLGPLPFGQEIWFSPAHTFSPTVLSGEDISQVEDKQKIRDGNIIPDTPPPTPLVPLQISSEQNLRKLTKKLKGELAKEFAPATPPSTPRNPSLNGLSENEQNTIEKEEFMLKLMRSLSEEVESSEDEEYPEMHVKSECSEKTAQYANNLATHIISLATDMAASYLHDKSFQEPSIKSHLNVQSQTSGYAALVNKDETLQCLQDYAGDVAGNVIREAKKMVKSKHCKLLRLKKNNCHVDSLCLKRDERDCYSKEKWNIQTEQWPREVDPLNHSLFQNSFMSGLTSKYPSCESVTDEYAGHIIQVLKREGANSELIMDQYASRLAYRSIKSGLQQAARKIQLKYNRKIFPVRSSQMNSKNELLKFLNKDKYQIDKKGQGKKNIDHLCENQDDERAKLTQRIDCPELLKFSESLAYSITRDVTRKLKMSTVGLPKSLTDSCLYKKSACEEDMGTYVESAFPKSLQLSSPKQKLYHSTSSLNEYGYGDSIIQAIEQYARKIVDDTLEISLESAVLQVSKNRKSADRFTYAEKLSPFSGTACRYCNLKEHQDFMGKSSQYFFGQESSTRNKPVPNSKLVPGCQKSRLFHLDVPKIHIDLEQKVVLAEKIVAAAIEKAERELSNTSLTADSGIGKDGVSFADSLTTEIMTSAMMNIGHNVNISSIGKEGFQSVDSVGSQQMSLSIGDDSSWSNLSFEDDHQDESSSFLHLSDSNGNSSSWSSLGLEGDMYEENLSFPTSDSDGTDDKDEEHKHVIEGLEEIGKKLLIVNIDMAPCVVDPQLRLALQWLAASEADVEQLYFHDSAKKEFMLLSKRVREKEWKVGDLLQAVLKYYEMMEKASDEERCKPLFCWILENA